MLLTQTYIDGPLVRFTITALQCDLLHVLADHLEAIGLVVIFNHQGEEFDNISVIKRHQNHHNSEHGRVYSCIPEKLLTDALARGIDGCQTHVSIL